MTMVERPLNYLELAHLDRVVIMAAEYQGDLDAGALDDAFRLLCKAYPVLGARVCGTPPDVSLVVTPEHQPELIVLDDVPGVLSKIAELPWDATKGVADLVLVHGDGHGYLALRTDHSITDANAWLGVFRELCRLFTAVVTGDVPEPAPSGYLTLGEEETSWLKRAARRYETTVHGLVAGAILLAQRVLAGGPAKVPMYSVSPVDFRNRVDPPVDVLETTNFMMSYVAEVAVSTKMSPVLIGKAIKTQLDEVLAAPEGVRATTPMQDSLGRNLSYALISNLGVIDDVPCPDGVSFGEFHILNTVGDTYFPGYYVSTYRGRLTVLYVFTQRFFSPDDVDRIVGELREQLLIVGASA